LPCLIKSSDPVGGFLAHAGATPVDLAIWETVGRETTFD